MPSDYQKQIKEIFGTADLDELRELAKMLKINNPNPRNAGRKAQLTPDQIVEVLELHRKGIGNTEIAKQFGVSRQTIYKYIYNAEHFSTDPDFTMRMNFMNGQQLCTVIDIDFKHEVVRMKNYTDRIPLRAFWRSVFWARSATQCSRSPSRPASTACCCSWPRSASAS